MPNYNYKVKLHKIKAFAFDVDGVLTRGDVISTPDGDLLRSFDAKDGFALRVAVKRGYPVAIITGGCSESIARRFRTLGIPDSDVYQRSKNKIPDFLDFCKRYSISPEEVAFAGDDIPDIPVMKICGLAVAPADAVRQVKECADYVSLYDGGRGCVRDLVEQTLVVQQKWEKPSSVPRITLASASPRRKELLSGLGYPFQVELSGEVDESYPEGTPVELVAQTIAIRKRDCFHRKLRENEILITADTVVICDGEILGKPASAELAHMMLRKLSGKSHQVITGVTITAADGQSSCFSTCSDVTFANLDDEEISFYIEHYKPFDKAGAYGIQEWIGFIGITSITGSYFNVMGLPVQRLYTELKRFL